MTMTEHIYVIKVKTKPPLSSLYPSERRYSASTVGGLSLVHFGLGTLSLLLGTLAVSLQGPILSVACLVPFVTGLLAWRRWYIDRNITLFFYGSLFSFVAAVLCFVVTIFDIAAVSGSAGRPPWPLESILNPSRYLRPFENPANDTRARDSASFEDNHPFNITGNSDFLKIDEFSKLPELSFGAEGPNLRDGKWNGGYDDLKAEASLTQSLEQLGTAISRETHRDKGVANIVESSAGSSVKERTETLSLRYEGSPHTGTLLILNVLVASLLEAFWSLLSARIAFRGMTNRLAENGGNDRVAVGSKATRSQKRKPPAPKPDILEHDRQLSGSLQNFASLQYLVGPGPPLPLPESSREFRERVERFLVNQATHRVVEGA